jgi:hypothetical protein
MKMGKVEFMKAYGDEVLAKYNVPTAEEIAALGDSDADEQEDDSELDLANTDDEKMDVDDETEGN